MPENRRKKIIPAIIAGAIAIMFLIGYMIMPSLLHLEGEDFVLFPTVIGIVFIICVIMVLRQRIKEINDGQEDDIDKY